MQWALKNAAMVEVSVKWVPPFLVGPSCDVGFGSSPKANPLTEKRTMETILAKLTLCYTRFDADLRQAKALASHGGDSLGSHVRGEQNVGVEAFGQQLVFYGGVIGIVPEVFVFPGIVFQVEELS